MPPFRIRRAACAAFALCLALAPARAQEWSRFEWVKAKYSAFFPVEVRNGKLFVLVTHGDEPLGEIFYDMGSSEFNVVTRALWQRLTGHTVVLDLPRKGMGVFR